MSQLLGRMFLLAALLLPVGTAAGREMECKEGMCNLSEDQLNAIVDRAYRLGYRKGYSEGLQKQQIIQTAPGKIPDFRTDFPLPPIRWVIPRRPDRSERDMRSPSPPEIPIPDRQ